MIDLSFRSFQRLYVNSSNHAYHLTSPRPISVNSSILPLSTVSTHKTPSRCTSEEIHNDDVDSMHSLNASFEYHPRTDVEMEDCETITDVSHQVNRNSVQFQNLPIEIHEAILDHLFGERASAANSNAHGPGSRSWVKALRHPRRKALSNLTLISPLWRNLVQERIYRHIKVKGTKDGLAECESWFVLHPHLVPHVRHIEVWVPVWGNRAQKNTATYPREYLPARRYLNEDNGLAGVNAVLQATVARWEDHDHGHRGSNNFAFHVACHNASLEEIFWHVGSNFPAAQILTLEAGHCKKPPLITHFAKDPSGLQGQHHLIQLPNIRTLVMRGAWNIMRDYRHWVTISDALPSLREWHCAYAKPKVEGYQTIYRALSNLSSSVVHLNISLEGFHSKDQSHWYGERASHHHHLCRLLGDIAPRLEHLSFTGNVCASLFNAARTAVAHRPQDARLKSLDLVVKTCCQEPNSESSFPLLEEPSGITNLKFIQSFGKLVLGAVRSLDTYLALSYIRIRFIDLDSTCALLNPYFQMSDSECTGLWNVQIIETLARVRPSSQFAQLSDGIYPQFGPDNTIIGAVYPRTRPLSINANNYKILSDAAKS
ncbi:hypothetical protein BGW36DRAFT_307032 [Talaromyces proteolyticus]|uniref:Uncharacterized protein n=1 Tax=Talaromyces proteolyticus TaxID=1131652 RepID=A0AAD4KIF9_9EURO|nr:uncharacterized protein BGW36DRAFT_307032 [Talaromyces proteolyticus]KAH8690110.1 hypothetical protein BGW36DRAFT_307032 [Talaromyces proteolyticus]